MPDSKISALVEDTTPAVGDFFVSDDISAGDNKKVSLRNLTLAEPAVGCSVQRITTNQAIATATLTAVLFNGETFDTDGFHDNVTNPSRMTVPAGLGGYYLLRGSGVWVANATGNREMFWKVNGTTFQPGSNRNGTLGGTDAVYMSAPTLVVLLAAGDFVELFGYQTSGGNLDLAFTDTVAGMSLVGR